MRWPTNSSGNDSQPALIKFRVSNGNHLVLYFPEREVCLMFPETVRKPVRTTGHFRAQYDCDVSFVPVLGPVEHNELLYQKEAARPVTPCSHSLDLPDHRCVGQVLGPSKGRMNACRLTSPDDHSPPV